METVLTKRIIDETLSNENLTQEEKWKLLETFFTLEEGGEKIPQEIVVAVDDNFWRMV